MCRAAVDPGMADAIDLEATDATERVVLYDLARLAERGETPATVLELVADCRDIVAGLPDVPGGKVTEADVVRACRSLAAEGLVAEVPADDTSPVGKGRPEFDLAVDPAAVRECVREDDCLAGLPDDEAA